MDEQYQRPLIENFQEPVFDEARKHELVDSVDIDSGLSVVQRTQIREALENAFRTELSTMRMEEQLIGEKLTRKPQRLADVAVSAIGLILGDPDGS